MAQKFSDNGTSIGANTLDANTDALDSDPFAYEHPSIVSYEQLEPTSGRKAWMIKHGKRIKKKLKADKRGYIGS